LPNVAGPVVQRTPAARDLDAERPESRRFCGDRLGVTSLVRARPGRGTGVPMMARGDCLSTFRRHKALAEILSHERHDAEGHLLAAVCGRYAQRRGGRLVVVAAGDSGRLRVTPDSAEQRGVRRSSQCHHDPDDTCSKHASLVAPTRKNSASGPDGSTRGNMAIPPRFDYLRA
jgi:hypothetical protein